MNGTTTTLDNADVIADRFDVAAMQRRVIAAVNRNDLAWLLWALGIPDSVSRTELAATVQQLLEAERNGAGEVLRQSPIDGLRNKIASREAVASLMFDFGPAIIMMLSSSKPRAGIATTDC
ncbi:MAG TPA: hypothetical protein VNT02_17030 [Burkholderiales bacterium]|nr:hypothetical protein [Burkholderiales bacterium]